MTQDGERVLCQRTGRDIYVLKTWDRATMPAVRESAYEIDQLLQEFMSASGFYDLVVFKFTHEQLDEILIRKLKGY